MRVKFKFVYHVLPVIVVYTNHLLRRRDALTVWLLIPVIVIRAACRNERAVLAHELAHARQSYRLYGLDPILYRSSARYRYRCELEAYRAQLQVLPGNEILYATFLATRYGLDVSPARALRDVKRLPGAPGSRCV